MGPVNDALARLPKLPLYRVNMYISDGPNREVADVFSRLIQKAFADQETDEEVTMSEDKRLVV